MGCSPSFSAGVSGLKLTTPAKWEGGSSRIATQPFIRFADAAPRFGEKDRSKTRNVVFAFFSAERPTAGCAVLQIKPATVGSVRPKVQMKILRRYSLVALMVAVVVTISAIGDEGQAKAQASNPASTQVGDAKNGRKVYTRYGCYECHGREGQGSSVSGPRLGPNPVQFTTFVRYVRQPVGDMPPYTEKVMSAQELADVYAFLQSLRHPPVENAIPPGN